MSTQISGPAPSADWAFGADANPDAGVELERGPGATSYNIYRDGTKVGSPHYAFLHRLGRAGRPAHLPGHRRDRQARKRSEQHLHVLVGIVTVFTSASSASTGMRVPFDFSVTTTGAPTASLSLTGNLPSGLTFTDNGDGTADISGIAAAGTAGTYPLTISANNGVGAPVAQPFVLTVTTATSPPVFTSDSSDTETFGVPFSFTVTTNGYPVPKLTRWAVCHPGSPSPTTATARPRSPYGTASASAVGSYPLTITAKSAAERRPRSRSLSIITKAPVLKKVTSQTAKTGTAYSKTITAVGSPTPALTETGALPAGITFTDNGDGTATLAGTPAGNAGGSYQITVTAATHSARPAIVHPEGRPASGDHQPGQRLGHGRDILQLSDHHYRLPSAQAEQARHIAQGPEFKAGTGTITGTPAAGTAGTYQIAIAAKNSTGSTVVILTIVFS